MAHIQVLPKQVADMIAAGEVVERPASVVKELVENAIDAGAKRVTAEIRHGGATYIRITDDGCGIPKEEVATAFLRHATSKLRSAEDLERIGTLGFRGEALAAISAVSHVEILTKPREQEMGWSYSIENSEKLEEGPAGCPDGTTIVVRDVFFSVPARYKYMKSDMAEAGAIHGVLEREALAHPEIAFRFVRDGKTVFTTPGDGELLHVIELLMPGESGELLPLQGGDDAIRVTGYVGKPTRCKGSRSGQHIFVNGRWIRSKAITAALEQAYQNQRMVGKFPVAVLRVDMALDKVDVNAHPAKTEVRFVEEKALFSRVYHTVLSALQGAQDRPRLQTAPVPERVRPAPAAESAKPIPAGPAQQSPVSAGDRLVFQSPAAQAVKPRPAVWPSEDIRPVKPAPVIRPGLPPLPQEEPEPPRQTTLPIPPAPSAPPPTVEETPEPEAPLPPEPEETPWRVVGEVLRTYIIVEQGDKILFIDKHAAHERMGFDALKAQDIRPMSQELLKPLVWRPVPEDRAELLERSGELTELGFQLEDFGGGDLVVRAAPDFLAYEDIASTLEELAQRYRTGAAVDPAAQRDGLLHTMACKAAMKGGQKNQAQELMVVAKAVMEGRVTHCPHGRPVATELTRAQLEKQFGRLGG